LRFMKTAPDNQRLENAVRSSRAQLCFGTRHDVTGAGFLLFDVEREAEA